MLTTEMTKKALNLAYERHQGQFDKQGVPYIFHPYSVAQLVDSEYEVTVALLHDILEDTDTTEYEIYKEFPKEVVEAVKTLTRLPDETYKDFIKRVSKNPLAKKVKLADLAHNTDKSRGQIPENLKERYEWAINYLSTPIND